MGSIGLEVGMQPDQVEVAFCDLCGSSVPEADFVANTATRFQGKTIGACCLGPLRSVPGASGGFGAERPPAAAGSHDGRLVPVAVALLAAIAAATIFVDYRIATSEQHRADAHRETLQTVRADRDAIQRIDVAMDGAARRADLEALAEKLTTAVDGSERDVARSSERFELLQKDLANLQRDVRAAAAAGVDYRPFFDEVRQQMQRQATMLADLRTHAVTAPVAPVEASNPPPTDPAPKASGAGGGADALPAALVEPVNKLKSNDAAVRFEAVDALLRSKNPVVLPHLLPLAKDSDAFVRRLVLQGLRDFKRGDVVEALIAALVDGDENVTDAAWKSLVEITGQKLAFEPTASKDARARAQKKWQDWWDKNKATFGS